MRAFARAVAIAALAAGFGVASLQPAAAQPPERRS